MDARARSPTKAQPKRILGRSGVRIEVSLVEPRDKLFRLESESVVQQLEAIIRKTCGRKRARAQGDAPSPGYSQKRGG